MDNDITHPALRVAFIGGGVNSAVGRAHFSAIHMDGRYRLVAGCFSRHQEINEQSARSYGVAPNRTYADFETLIAREREDLDAVIVLTPTSFHVDPVTAALDAGIPVICEKALAGDLDEVASIRSAELRNTGFLTVTYNYTGYPALRELRAMISAAKLGRILHFVAEMPQEGFIRRDADGRPVKPQDWRLHDGKVPTVYLDLGVHLHQIIYYLIGARPERVSAFHGSYGNFPGIIDFVDACVDYEGGIHGRFYFGKSMLGHRNGLKIRVFGTDASAAWEQINPEEIHFAHADGRIEVLDRGAMASVCNQPRYTRFKAGHPAGYIEAFANYYEDIATSLSQYLAQGKWDSQEAFGSQAALEGMALLHSMVTSSGQQNAVTRTELI